MAGALNRPGVDQRRAGSLVALRIALATAAFWACTSAPAWALGPDAPFTPAPLFVPANTSAGVSGQAGATTPPIETGFAGVLTGRTPLALIDGQWWALGAQLPQRGSARLVAVDGQGATLRHADGRSERLALFSSSAVGGNKRLGSTTLATKASQPTSPAAASKTPQTAALPSNATPFAPLAARSTP